MSDSNLISVRGLTVGYGRQPVLENVTFGILKGTSCGLLGANGSGKTTLLKTIARILPPLAGEVTYAVGAVAGYVPQRETLDSPFLLSSLEVALMGLCGRVSAGKRPSKSDREFVLQCLRRTGAEDLARKPFAQLSGGQKQRVLIARALAAHPDILLLDEPTAGIDPQATAAIASLLKELQKAGMTLLMVNHDLPVVRQTTDTVLWIRGGQLQQGLTETMLSEHLLERVSLQLE